MLALHRSENERGLQPHAPKPKYKPVRVPDVTPSGVINCKAGCINLFIPFGNKCYLCPLPAY